MPLSSKRLEMLKRRKAAASRYLRGQTQWEIAQALECSQQTISIDLRAIQREWEERAVESRKAWIARILAAIEEVEAAAWIAWKKSQENAEVLRAKMRGGNSETEKVSKGQAGDPRFLSIIMQCQKDKTALLGLQKLAEQKEGDSEDLVQETLMETVEACKEAEEYLRVNGVVAPESGAQAGNP